MVAQVFQKEGVWGQSFNAVFTMQTMAGVNCCKLCYD